MDEVLKVLETCDQDLQYRPSNAGLMLFLEHEEDLTEEQGAMGMENMRENWPDLQHITAARTSWN